MYKVGTPAFDYEPDWTVTQSEIEFPWSEVRFGDFTTAECYQKFKQLITDEFQFNKYV